MTFHKLEILTYKYCEARTVQDVIIQMCIVPFLFCDMILELKQADTLFIRHSFYILCIKSQYELVPNSQLLSYSSCADCFNFFRQFNLKKFKQSAHDLQLTYRTYQVQTISYHLEIDNLLARYRAQIHAGNLAQQQQVVFSCGPFNTPTTKHIYSMISVHTCQHLYRSFYTKATCSPHPFHIFNIRLVNLGSRDGILSIVTMLQAGPPRV